MNKTFKVILILTLVSFLSGFFLSFAYKKFNPKILENQKKETREKIFEIIPKAQRVEEKLLKDKTINFVYDKKTQLLGYCSVGEGFGYQGKIKVLVCVDKDFKKILGIDIIEHSETPGLGAKITQKNFRDQFKGLKTDIQIKVKKRKALLENNEIQAISGATISSESVTKIVNETLKELRKILKK